MSDSKFPTYCVSLVPLINTLRVPRFLSFWYLNFSKCLLNSLISIPEFFRKSSDSLLKSTFDDWLLIDLNEYVFKSFAYAVFVKTPNAKDIPPNIIATVLFSL